MCLEAVYVRVAQYTILHPSVAQPTPRTIARETPVSNDGERGGEHAPVERERGAKVRCEAILR